MLRVFVGMHIDNSNAQLHVKSNRVYLLATYSHRKKGPKPWQSGRSTETLGRTSAYYTGTVSLATTSPTGTVTALGSYTFTAADNGAHTFSATLTTAGTQSLTATDVNGLIGSDPRLVVSAAAAGEPIRLHFVPCQRQRRHAVQRDNCSHRRVRQRRD